MPSNLGIYPNKKLVWKKVRYLRVHITAFFVEIVCHSKKAVAARWDNANVSLLILTLHAFLNSIRYDAIAGVSYTIFRKYIII